MRQTIPLRTLQLASQWPFLWVFAIAVSTAMVHLASSSLLVPMPSQFADQETGLTQSVLLSDQLTGSLIRVSCPTDASGAALDVLVTSLQDLELLVDSLCVAARPAPAPDAET